MRLAVGVLAAKNLLEARNAKDTQARDSLEEGFRHVVGVYLVCLRDNRARWRFDISVRHCVEDCE
jgi:hypothetical protein